MFQEGSYWVKIGDQLPRIGEVKEAKDANGKVSKIIVHKITGLSWADEKTLLIELVVETRVPKKEMQKYTKSQISVLKGKKK